jgi:PIN domain nuclease of toxin-antitoxin system
LLPIEVEHTWTVRELPDHHRDPFDRLPITQAQVERLPILTSDPVFAHYEAETISE